MTATEPEETYWIAAVEAGGTSFKIAICQAYTKDPQQRPILVHRTEIDSQHSSPQQTLQECATFLRQFGYAYRSLGIATFGPVGLRASDPETYGRILSTCPKQAWRNVDLLTPLAEACATPNVRMETDVNAPAWAEYQKTSGISSCAYITVGTGVGVGLVVHHQTVHGRMHPEGGHVAVPPLKGDDFGGYSWGASCPYGGRNTVEGLTSSVALTERLQRLQPPDQPLARSVLSTLPDDHELWDHAANALASLCVTLILTLSIERIVLGGGVMNRRGLLEKIQARTVELVNGYVELPVGNMSSLIAHSAAGEDAGLVGAIVLAHSACQKDEAEVEQQKCFTRAKQTAFGYGLWHGMIVGSVLTAVLCKRFFRSSR